MKPAILFTIFLFAALFACKPPASTTTADNSRNALDWKGLYSGVLPCADCEGIMTSIQLNDGLTYQMRTVYLGKSNKAVVNTGSFSWDEKGSIITLNGADKQERVKFKVGENKLIQLDKSGNIITGEMAYRYHLGKISNAIAGKYWKAVELMGKKVVYGPNNNREAHFILHPADMRISGSDGCNRITGTYTLLPNNRLKFSPLASTQMACPGNDETARDFSKALQTADSYYVSGDSLQLNRARMAPLGRFVAVYLQ